MAVNPTKYKNQWAAENTERIVVNLDKDLVGAFKSKCQAEGVSQASVIREALKKYVEK